MTDRSEPTLLEENPHKEARDLSLNLLNWVIANYGSIQADPEMARAAKRLIEDGQVGVFKTEIEAPFVVFPMVDGDTRSGVTAFGINEKTVSLLTGGSKSPLDKLEVGRLLGLFGREAVPSVVSTHEELVASPSIKQVSVHGFIEMKYKGIG